MEHNAVSARVSSEAIFGTDPALMWIMATRTTADNLLQFNARFAVNVILRLDVDWFSGT
jgi:hypothetical protein